MNIPNKIKIGGKTYNVIKTKNIDLGNTYYSAEIDYRNLEIRICPNNKEKMEVDFLHEMFHGILDFLGYSEHDEKHVDELANTLYMVIKDNPKMFKG